MSALFDQLCEAHGLPVPEKEYRFCPPRRWRFDYCWDGWLALEVEGFAAGGAPGRHQRVAGFKRDMEKYNQAQIMGFTVLRCLPEDINTGTAFALVKRALAACGSQCRVQLVNGDGV